MEAVNGYLETLDHVFSIATPLLNETTEFPSIEKERLGLEKTMRNQSYLKLPVIGGFNAGKSTLINTVLGKPLLPTNITPETALAYELYYSEDEKIEVVEQGKVTETLPLSSINEVKYRPTLYVKVYLNNDNIKSFNDKGIVVVDMPGLDSGVEQHNNAIMSYIEEGTVFALIVDSEHGSLNSSVITFLKEIRTYGLKVEVFLSKIEKKGAGISTIREYVTQQAKRYISENAQVRAISSIQGNVGEFIDFVNSVDAEQCIQDRFKIQVQTLIMKVIAALNLQLTLKRNSPEEYDEIIRKIQMEKAKAISDLHKRMENTQNLDGSVEDIMNDLRTALINNSFTLANIAIRSEGRTNELQNQLLSIIRPVLINGVKRELTEYSDSIAPVLEGFVNNIQGIISQSDTSDKILQGLAPMRPLLEGGLMKLIAKMVANLPILKFVSLFVGPIIDMVFTLIGNILEGIFGFKAKRENDTLMKIQQKFEGEITNQIVANLRPEVTRLIQEERRKIDAQVTEVIQNEAQKYDDEIEATRKKAAEDKEKRDSEIDGIEKAVEEITLALKKVG